MAAPTHAIGIAHATPPSWHSAHATFKAFSFLYARGHGAASGKAQTRQMHAAMRPLPPRRRWSRR